MARCSGRLYRELHCLDGPEMNRFISGVKRPSRSRTKVFPEFRYNPPAFGLPLSK
jgi:hypothetical protein